MSACRVLAAIVLSAGTLARAQSPAAPTDGGQVDSARTIARACDALRYGAEGLRESDRERQAVLLLRRAARARVPRAASVCLVARADVRALAGDVAFLIDSISAFLRTLDEFGERRAATDLRLMRGGALIAPGRLQMARDDLARSMADARAIADTTLEFYAALNLSQLLYASGDPVSAFRPAKRGIDLAPHLAAAERAVAVSLEGDILANQGQWVEAAALYDSSSRLALQAGYAGGAAHAMELRGSMAMRLEQWDLAQAVLEAALRTLTRGGYGGNVGQLNYLLASVALRRGRFREAHVRLNAAARDALADGNLLYFIRLREAELRWREGDLDEAARRLHQAADVMDQYRTTLTHRDVRLTAFEASPDDTDPDAGVASILAALVVHGRAREALEITERSRARELIARLRAPTAARDASGLALRLQRGLPSGVAVVEYVVGRGGEPTSILLVTRDTIRGFVTTPVDSLESPIARLRATLEGSGNAVSVASTLGAALVDSVVAHLPPTTSTLVIVPDGALHRVSFDVLRLADGRYVFERLATSVAPSAEVALAMFESARQVGEGVVAVGGLTYRSAVGDSLPPLPDAAREAAMVARLSRASTLLRGARATIAAFAATVRDPRAIIHIATHARADEYGVGSGAIAFAADSNDDGMLTATSLLDLGVRADLVVLSACRSGIGPLVRGEGMQALTAPFVAAGTRSLLATMWIVGDRSTFPLMTEFYRELAGGQPVAESLRRVRVRAWRSGAPPREWAAFVAVGDPTVRIALDAPRSPHVVWVAVAALMAAVAAFAGYRTVRRA